MSTKEEDDQMQRRKRALANLWQAYTSYQEWQKDDGDVETFLDFVREELPDLMPVTGEGDVQS
jgi:hypothetical protein